MDVEKSQSSYNERIKTAVAVALYKSKLRQKENVPPNGNNNASVSLTNSHSDNTALKWKCKAKEHKEQIWRLQGDLKAAEGEKKLEDGSDWRFSDVLHRRFLRQVRIKHRRGKGDAAPKRSVLGTNSQNEVEQLSASVDFLVEL